MTVLTKRKQAQHRAHILSFSATSGSGIGLLEDGRQVVLHRELLQASGIRRLHPGCVVKVEIAEGWPHPIATRMRLVRCRQPLAVRRILRAARRASRHIDEAWMVTSWRLDMPGEGRWLH